MFFNGHKRENVIEYQETFFNEMKSFLPSFVNFFEDDTMVLKKYPHDYAVKKPDQRSIVMITYDESIFSTKNRRRKVWTFNNQGILKPKRKRKEIIYNTRFPTFMIKT